MDGQRHLAMPEKAHLLHLDLSCPHKSKLKGAADGQVISCDGAANITWYGCQNIGTVYYAVHLLGLGLLSV